MKLSVIIPALNEERLIGKCIRSLNSQTILPDEIIVVDNGSTDNTIKIAKNLGCKIVTEKTNGPSPCRNTGAKNAKGEILCFIDADGEVSRDWVKACKEILSQPKVKAVSGLNIFTQKSLAKKIWYNTYSLGLLAASLVQTLLLHKPALVANNLAIKKDAFWELGGFQPIHAEGLWLTKTAETVHEFKSKFVPSMKIFYSSRGFDSTGYLKTLFFWGKHALLKTKMENYSYKSHKDLL